MKKLAGVLCAFLAAILLCACQQQKLYKESRLLMGTFVEVDSPDSRAAGIVFNEIQRIENLLSKYKPASEVSRLNAAGRLKVSAEVFYVLKKSVEFYKASDGAFDITVGPLMDLWGFTDKQCLVPDKSKVQEALARVGSDKILLHDATSVVEFKNSGMKIDLGGIAKGFALDCAVKKLKEANIKSCLINAGGQVYCLGEISGRPWRIAIRDSEGKGLRGSLELKDASASTSGDYEQYFRRGNKRYGHIFDPRTGFPADSGIASVTVVAPDGLTADALSTAIFVLGRTRAEALLARFPGVYARIL